MAYTELSAAVRGCYDLQQLRIQAGGRLYANFRARLKDETPEDEDEVKDELSAKAQRVIDKLKESYARLTSGIARNRTLPSREGFQGDEIINTFSELIIVDQFLALEREEKKQFRNLEYILADIPIYTQWLIDQRGVGPAMAGVLLSRLDPTKARHVSGFWKYSGLDVASDGRGRSRREEHLVEREYKDKKGQTKTRRGVTFDPWLKTKLMGVMAASFLRSNSPWREHYNNYKHRISTDPNRIKITVEEWKKRYATGEDVTRLWTPGRIDFASKRYMVKMFIQQLWEEWRRLEGLSVGPTYIERMRGYPHAAE
jgi:hypothetical protein